TKAKSVSGIADVQDCGVSSSLSRQTIWVRELRYWYFDYTVQIVGSQMYLHLLHDFELLTT
ncbi:hypothetical protein, partial [Bacillus thuringiensis]|uniref:hypothetical protein n=1 Tax=Bacillus thuringiensis TaxID=1428 RepID=UPI001A8EAA59